MGWSQARQINSNQQCSCALASSCICYTLVPLILKTPKSCPVFWTVMPCCSLPCLFSRKSTNKIISICPSVHFSLCVCYLGINKAVSPNVPWYLVGGMQAGVVGDCGWIRFYKLAHKFTLEISRSAL